MHCGTPRVPRGGWRCATCDHQNGKTKDHSGVCLDKALDFETATKKLEEELETLAQAKHTVAENIAETLSIVYGLNQTVFLEVGLDNDLSDFRQPRVF